MRTAESTFSFVLPPEMRELYRQSDGTRSYDPERMLRFLPIEEWCPATEFAAAGREQEHEGCLVFAEHSVWVHEYALRQRDGAILLVYGDRPRRVASSFREFLGLYLLDAGALFPWIG